MPNTTTRSRTGPASHLKMPELIDIGLHKLSESDLDNVAGSVNLIMFGMLVTILMCYCCAKEQHSFYFLSCLRLDGMSSKIKLIFCWAMLKSIIGYRITA